MRGVYDLQATMARELRKGVSHDDGEETLRTMARRHARCVELAAKSSLARLAMPVRLLQVLVLATLAVCRPLSSTALATSRPVLLRRTNFAPLAVAVSPPLASADTADADAAPPSLTPIYLGVFTQMLSEGIAIGTLPLHMTLMGGSPLEVAAATSGPIRSPTQGAVGHGT